MTQFGCFARGNHSSAWQTGRGGHTTLLQYPVTGCTTVMVVYHTRWKYVGRGYRSTSLYYISHSTDAVAWYQLWWILTCRCKVSCALRSVHLHTLHNAKSGQATKSVCTLTSPWRHLSSFKFLTYSTSRQLFCSKLKSVHFIGKAPCIKHLKYYMYAYKYI